MSKVGDANRYAAIREAREEARDIAIDHLVRFDGAVKTTISDNYFVTPVGDVYSALGRRLMKLSPGIKKSGYRFVGISNGTKRATYHHVHRLVALAFIENKNNFSEVNHKDGNKSNNCVSNLEWISRSANAQHALDTGLNKQKGLSHRGSKLNEEQVRAIRNAKSSYRDIGRSFGVCVQTVCNIKALKTYKDVR